MSRSKKVKSARRVIQRAIHADTLRLSSMLTYLQEFIKRNNPRNPGKFAPALKNYKNMIIDKRTNKESSISYTINPGCESNLPPAIHPKEIRIVTLAGYNSNTKPGDEEFEEWFESFNSTKILEWIENIIRCNTMHKQYCKKITHEHPSEGALKDIYAKYTHRSSCPCIGCPVCMYQDRSKLSDFKSRKQQNMKIRIGNDMGEMHNEKYIGKREFRSDGKFRKLKNKNIGY